MENQNLGILLSIVGGSLGLTALISGGFFALIAILAIYYTVVGFILTELTEITSSIIGWLPELFK